MEINCITPQKGDYFIKKDSVEILRHILDARIDNSSSQNDYFIWCNIRDIVEYAFANNIDCLRQFDYLEAKED